MMTQVVVIRFVAVKGASGEAKLFSDGPFGDTLGTIIRRVHSKLLEIADEKDAGDISYGA